ncbi:MAG: urea carboxylase-associated protein [Bdellovibrio sp. ArHS]|nr:MAG: urea carboxylase-associated protein [Bdellovibrio sp. ArHS]
MLPAQTGAAFLLRQGELLRVTTPEDHQVADLFCFNARDLWESLSAGRSIDWAETIYLTEGHHLYSNRSNPMLTILGDSCGRHDFLMTPCSLRMFQIVAGNNDYHPSCHENLAKNLAEFGIHEDQISTTFNIFMNVTVDGTGGVTIECPKAKAGDSILFLAEMDLVVGLTACSHEGTNHGTCKPIWYRKESF